MLEAVSDQANEVKENLENNVKAAVEPERLPAPAQSEQSDSMPERLKALEKRLGELFTSPAQEPAATEVEPEIRSGSPVEVKPAPRSALPSTPEDSLPSGASSLFAPEQLIPGQAMQPSPTASPLPDLMGQLDRIKYFFEDMRKPSTAARSLLPALDQDAPDFEPFPLEPTSSFAIPAELRAEE
jgi:hypothetical protein